MIANEQVEAALKAWYDAGDAGNFASMFAALKAADLEAAARIAELEAENIKLRTALKFYSCQCDLNDNKSQRCGGAHDEQFCGYVAHAALENNNV